MTSREQGGCRILTKVRNVKMIILTTTSSDGLLSIFHCDNIFTICIVIIEIRRKKNPVMKNSFDTPPPVSWYLVFLSVLTELSLPCLPGLPSVCIFSVLRRKFNICETLAWSLGAIYVTGTEMLHNLLYFGDDTFPMWSKKVTNTIAAHAWSSQGRIYIVGLADKHCLFSTNQNQFLESFSCF